jgi:hypothetical protein
MNTRLLLLAFAALLGSCSIFHRNRPDKAPVVETVRTPDSPTPPTAARDLADVMTTTLSLRPEQTGQVRQILSTLATDANAARQKYPAQSPQLNAELKRIITASENSLKQTLGPTKYKEYQAKRKQIQTEMQQRAR